MKQLCVCLLLMCGVAEAQQAARPKVPARKYEVSLGGGIALPFSPDVFQNYWTLAYHVSGGFGYSLNPRLTLSVLGEYNSFVFNSSTSATSFGSTATISGFVNLKYSFLPLATARKWYPYVLAGAGVMNASISAFNATPSATAKLPIDQMALGIDGGVGLEYRLNTTTFIFVEGRGAMAFVTGDSYIALPARVGMRIRF